MINNRKLTKEDIALAFDQNIMVFDNLSIQPELTAKLGAHMIDVGLFNFHKRLTDIYIPETVQYDEYPTCAGLEVHVTPELNIDGELFAYYKELGGVLYMTAKHTHLAIGLGEDDFVLLGSLP